MTTPSRGTTSVIVALLLGTAAGIAAAYIAILIARATGVLLFVLPGFAAGAAIARLRPPHGLPVLVTSLIAGVISAVALDFAAGGMEDVTNPTTQDWLFRIANVIIAVWVARGNSVRST